MLRREVGSEEVTQRVFPEWLPTPQKAGDIKILHT